MRRRRTGRKALKITAGIVRTVAWIVTLAALLLLSVMVIPRIVGFYPYVIQSGSMEPTIHAGAVAFIDQRADEVQTGDIVAFRHPEDEEIVVVHRVVETYENGFLTQGDANEAPDSEEIPLACLMGRFRFSIPYLGYVVSEITLPRLEWGIAVILGLNVAAEVLRKIERKGKKKYGKYGKIRV